MTKAELITAIDNCLDSLRPYLETDGGNIEVIEVSNDNILKIKLLGNCESCPMSYLTMKSGIEETIKKSFPQITSVVAINAKAL